MMKKSRHASKENFDLFMLRDPLGLKSSLPQLVDGSARKIYLDTDSDAKDNTDRIRTKNKKINFGKKRISTQLP